MTEAAVISKRTSCARTRKGSGYISAEFIDAKLYEK